MPPEDELADELPLRDETETDAEPEPDPSPSPSDSGVDFAVGGEAPEDSTYEYQDYQGPTEDLTGELAETAGEEASYGYDTASETARFTDRQELSDLTESVPRGPDESDQYKLSESDHGENPASFAEEAATAGGEEPQAYEPPLEPDDGGYASHHPDLESHHPELATTPAPAEDDSGEMGPAAAFTVEEEPEPPEAARPEPKTAPSPRASAAPAPRAEPPVDNSPKPGQVRKSAIDEMFARAAELKRQKGR